MPANTPLVSREVVVDSPANPFIKFLKSLSLKKKRDQHDSFFAEGLQASIMALNAGFEVQAVVFSPSLAGSALAQAFVARCRDEQLKVVEVSARAFRTLSRFDKPGGVGVLARQRYVSMQEFRAGGPLRLLALEEIQYAGNLGTILRTCDAAGMNGVILLDRAVDPFSPEVVKASMGCIFTQHLARASAHDLLEFCARQAMPLIAATPEAPQHQVPRLEQFVLLLGSERQGLSPLLRGAVSTQVSIPMRGHADSLNIAVAAGILMYQLLGE